MILSNEGDVALDLRMLPNSNERMPTLLNP